MAGPFERPQALQQPIHVIEGPVTIAVEDLACLLVQLMRQVEPQPQLLAVVESQREVPAPIWLVERLLGKSLLDLGLCLQVPK